MFSKPRDIITFYVYAYRHDNLSPLNFSWYLPETEKDETS